MDGFESTLREQVEATQHELGQAARLDETFEIHLHGARLMDLLDRASAHAIDTTDWVDNSLLALARKSI
jgi:hypothetical protein